MSDQKYQPKKPYRLPKDPDKPLTDKVYTRAPYWSEVPDEIWMDWRWQMANRLNSVEELGHVVNLTASERKALSADGLFRVDITPYFASLIDPDDPSCPVRRQIIPTSAEMVPFQSMMEDSLAEDKHSPVPGLVHRYPDRVLMLVTTQCASYCRYCTRSRIVGDPTQTFSRAEFEAQIDYLERTPQVRDVLLSGGDPMVLSPKIFETILQRLHAIPHIEIVRIGSRVPVFLPMRVTEEFCATVEKYHPSVDQYPRQSSQRNHARTGRRHSAFEPRRCAAGQSERLAGRDQRFGTYPAQARPRSRQNSRASLLFISMRSRGRLRPFAHDCF